MAICMLISILDILLEQVHVFVFVFRQRETRLHKRTIPLQLKLINSGKLEKQQNQDFSRNIQKVCSLSLTVDLSPSYNNSYIVNKSVGIISS